MVIDSLLAGLAFLANPWTILAAGFGLVVGIVVGALPGLTATMAVAVLSPFTFFMDAAIGIPFLLGVYKAAIYAGSIPAITINTPGTAAAAATALDGHWLARRGQARKALEMSLYASVFGDLLATFVLIFAATALATVALRFGAPEFAALFLFSLTMIAAVSGGSMVKGLISAAIGVFIACIGLDPMSGYNRFTFGSVDLMGGVSLVPLLIGMFALSEILIRSESLAAGTADTSIGHERLNWREFRATLPTLFRSSGIGAFIGALPGLGAEISCWIAYGVAKRRSKRPQEFGRGSLEGIAAAEAGNNAVCPAALVPLLVFGIPGDTVTAILLGAFMAQGLTPGPMLFESHGATVYGLFAILLATNVMLLGFGLLAVRWLPRITLIPDGLLFPAVTILCFAGSYSVNSSLFDVFVMVAGGAAGYLMRKTGVPVPPLVIGLLLAPGLENSLRQTMMLSDNSLSIFVERPIAAGILALIALVVLGAAARNVTIPNPFRVQWRFK